MVLHNKFSFFEALDSKYSSSFSFYVFDLSTFKEQQGVKFNWISKGARVALPLLYFQKLFIYNIEVCDFCQNQQALITNDWLVKLQRICLGENENI